MDQKKYLTHFIVGQSSRYDKGQMKKSAKNRYVIKYWHRKDISFLFNLSFLKIYNMYLTRPTSLFFIVSSYVWGTHPGWSCMGKNSSSITQVVREIKKEYSPMPRCPRRRCRGCCRARSTAWCGCPSPRTARAACCGRSCRCAGKCTYCPSWSGQLVISVILLSAKQTCKS